MKKVLKFRRSEDIYKAYDRAIEKWLLKCHKKLTPLEYNTQSGDYIKNYLSDKGFTEKQITTMLGDLSL